ncbi:hypothetical protein ERJ75_001234200 [Trypanosoma vivax]|uniref:Uncharacterized protein n=1 Tax=Trypanosoma vivax (strain Y486) TaxID=1055687 RepID=G0U0S9_TRYVY|nr:hypothetical protein TRVL_07536 [Trypanosoma vivax]KAH8608989.1 hypothetical protein ERJ75_001234200 [Trypanosoma vivax]CCC49679.1 conserved hypothetical protein [Trypanosoma vivax Y486]
MSVGKHKRAQGEPAFALSCLTPCLPATLRSQFQFVSEDNLNAIERRLKHTETLRLEDERIRARCARAMEQKLCESRQRVDMLQKRAARQARVAGLVEEKRIRAELQKLCRW